MHRGMEEPKQRFDLVEILLQHGIQVAVLQQLTDLTSGRHYIHRNILLWTKKPKHGALIDIG